MLERSSKNGKGFVIPHGMNEDSRIAWAIAEMERRPEMTLDGLVRATNLSRSRFAHLFRLHTGVPPGKYLRDVRFARARTLLETTFLSIKEVMAEVGFHDPSHFSRDFQAAFGVSPSQWRKRVVEDATRPRATDELAHASRAP
jgi:AraC family transcriptional regulator, arabinose operon regulatory protein